MLTKTRIPTLLTLALICCGAAPATKPAPAKPTPLRVSDLPDYLQTFLKFRKDSYKIDLASLRELVAHPRQDESAAQKRDYATKLQLLMQHPESYVPAFPLPWNNHLTISVGVGGGEHMSPGWSWRFTISQRIDETSALVTSGDTLVMIKGVDFSKVADGAEMTIPCPLIATKTITYSNAGGSTSTVILLEPLLPILEAIGKNLAKPN